MLFCLLLSTTVASWTYRMCHTNDYSVCSDSFLGQDTFSISNINTQFISDPSKEYLLIKNDDANPTDITISFDNLNYNIGVEFINPSSTKTLTIVTNLKTYSNTTVIKQLQAEQYNVIIKNTNTDLSKNTIFVRELSFLTINSSDDRELKIVSDQKPCMTYEESSSTIDSEKLGKSVTFQTYQYSISITKEPTESKIFTIEPILFYGYYTRQYCAEYPNIDQRNSEFYVHENHFSCSSIKCVATYGKRKVTLSYTNQKTITFIVENPRAFFSLYLGDGSTISCEDGLTSNDIIPPSISGSIAKDAGGIILKGNWPNFRKYSVSQEYYGRGLWIRSMYYRMNFNGKFIYEANNFPLGDDQWRNVDLELILTQKNSSINGNFQMYNLTIRLKDDIETDFYINGEVHSYKNTYINDNSEPKTYLGKLFTFSQKLKIYVQTLKKDFLKEGPAKVYFQTIDNSGQEIDNTELNIAPNGRVINPYTLYYHNIGDSFEKIYNDYNETNPEPIKGSSYRVFYDYYIKFAKKKAKELSDALDTLSNRFPTLSINPPNGNNFNIIFSRNDYPVASLYRLSLKKKLNSVCATSGTFDKSKVKTTFGNSFVEGINNAIDEGFDTNKYLPIISDQTMTGNDFITEDNKCIGFEPTSIPGSSAEFFFYTSNSTYIEILQKIHIISLLTPDDLEAKSKLFNPNSKNIFIACMDDTPSDKSLNFKNGIREDANIFLFGIPFKAFDDMMNSIEYIDSLNESDPNIDYDNLVYSNITKLIAKYQTFIPKVNLLLGKVQTLMAFFVDFIGTNIECSNFFALGSKFSQADKLTLNAATTIAETESYKDLQTAKKTFNNLFILPIHVSPPNLLEINTIQFSDTEWLLKYDKSSITDNQNFMVNTPGEFKIDSSHVIGNLIVFSITKGVDFCISDKLIGTVVKGAGIITDYETFMDVKSVPGMMILEDGDKNSKKKETKKNEIRDFITEEGFKIFQILTKSIIKNKDMKENTNKNIKMNINKNDKKGNNYKQNHKFLREESESATTQITFTGWEKIKEVKGEMKIDVGKSSIIAESIPKAVMEVAEFMSKEEVKLSPIDKNTIFTKPQIISSTNKKYVFPEGHIVSFTNITFNNANAKLNINTKSEDFNEIYSLSLDIGTKTNSDINTDHLKITQATAVDFDSTQITVKQSIEVEPESKFMAKSLKAENTKLIMNYKLSADFATLPDNYEPGSITLKYIGESTDEALLDYSKYLGAIYNIRTFSDEENCNKWKNAITMQSEYKDFQQGSPSIQLLCFEQKSSSSSSSSLTATTTTTKTKAKATTKSSILGDSTTLSSTYILQLNVTAIPSTEKSNNDLSKEKDKLPIGAIVGGVIGGVAAVAIIVVLVWFFAFRNKKSKVEAATEGGKEEGEENKP